MNLIRHPAGALIIFAIMISLSLTIYVGFEENYGVITDSKLDEDGFHVMEALNNLRIIEGLQVLETTFTDSATPTGSNQDILGALAAAGIGVTNLIIGIFTFPFEIFAIILKFYHIPNVIIIGLEALIICYLSFLMISAYLGRDL